MFYNGQWRFIAISLHEYSVPLLYQILCVAMDNVFHEKFNGRFCFPSIVKII